jgi:hypothetical protein
MTRSEILRFLHIASVLDMAAKPKAEDVGDVRWRAQAIETTVLARELA